MSIALVGSVGIGDTGSGGGTNVTIAGYTVPAGTAIMVIEVLTAFPFSTTNTPTWNGSSVGMTPAGSVSQSTSTKIERWYLVSPTVTTASVVVGKAAASRYGVRVRLFSGVDLTTPFRAETTRAATAASPSIISPVSQVGDLVIDAINVRTASVGSMAATAPQVDDWSGTISATTNEGGISHKDGAAGTTSMEWTYAGGTIEVTHLAAALIPAAGGGGVPAAAILNYMY